MEKLQLSFLFKIIGLGSASGLIYHNNTIIAIGDNSTYLYEYPIDSAKLYRFPLVENAQENIPKKQKQDLEAITQYQDSLYIFGSGSTENRTKMLHLDAKSKKVLATNDVSDLYLALQSFGKIKPEDFNLEGAIYNGENWFLFNRGIGRIDCKTMQLDFTIKIEGNYKLEGITLFQNNKDSIEFLVCEDKDNDILETSIYKLVISLEENGH